MVTKEHILDVIRKIAKEEGRTPGQKLFKSRTGLSHSYWNGTYWPRWSAAIREAGLEENKKNQAIPKELLLKQYLDLVEELGSVPTLSDLQLKNRQESGFPAKTTFQKRFGGQKTLINASYEFAQKNQYSETILDILREKVESFSSGTETLDNDTTDGWVYLLKSGEFYKIGRGSNLERRVKQVSTAMPETLDLVHSIKTDDAVGIENYWHRRFKDKRANGEWFKLSTEDVKAFKRRKFQ